MQPNLIWREKGKEGGKKPKPKPSSKEQKGTAGGKNTNTTKPNATSAVDFLHLYTACG